MYSILLRINTTSVYILELFRRNLRKVDINIRLDFTFKNIYKEQCCGVQRQLQFASLRMQSYIYLGHLHSICFIRI